MAKIKSFKGLLYNNTKIGGDYSLVTAPPYDIISESIQDNLYTKHIYNIVRISLGKSLNGDSEKSNKYTRARNFLDEWQKSGVLIRDKEDALYVYLQEYEYKGAKHRRIGFIALMEIENKGERTVFPHECTLNGPKIDRINLMKEVEADICPIFGLYDDKDSSINKILLEVTKSSKPIIDVAAGGESHLLWRLEHKNTIDKVTSKMLNKEVLIADGHHRYEAARLYRNLRREETDYDGSADDIMMYFTDSGNDKNLAILATHRAIKEIPQDNAADITVKLSEYFHMVKYPNLTSLVKSLEENSSKSFYFGFFNGKEYFLISPKSEEALVKLINEKKSIEWKKLDVSVLHSSVLNNILGIRYNEGNIFYTKDPDEADSLVRCGAYKLAFFLNPTRLTQLKAVVAQGDMMPHKSTYFYPKPLTGLVLYKFGE